MIVHEATNEEISVEPQEEEFYGDMNTEIKRLNQMMLQMNTVEQDKGIRKCCESCPLQD